jgi:hypothetical protein
LSALSAATLRRVTLPLLAALGATHRPASSRETPPRDLGGVFALSAVIA